MNRPMRQLILEDGSTYTGYGFGAETDTVCEVVFNTSMAGYQEIVSDPSYADQAIVMTYPLIGNYGITDEDFESRQLLLKGLIVRDYNDMPSNFRYTNTLSELLSDHGVPGISGIDTRKLVRSIRDYGTRRGLITNCDTTVSEGLEVIRNTPIPHDAVMRAGCKKRRYVRTADHRFHVVAVDCGMKLNIVRMLNRYGCNVTIVPCDTGYEEIRLLHPDGIFISNGPGDPTDVPSVIRLLQQIRGEYPVFGICLGHQLLALSYGAKTYKLKFGHRGGNHPVKDLRTGKIAITSQNHSYAVDESTVPGTGLTVTHRNLLDGTVEGLCCEKDRAFSVQYHPESAPGPQDSTELFERFISLMSEEKGN